MAGGGDRPYRPQPVQGDAAAGEAADDLWIDLTQLRPLEQPQVAASLVAPELREAARLLERCVCAMQVRAGRPPNVEILEVFADAATSIRLTADALEHIVDYCGRPSVSPRSPTPAE